MQHAQILPTLPSLLESEQLGSTIKQWFEKNRQADFVGALDLFVDNTQRDIQVLCHHNYQEFLKSVDELVTLRQNASKLRGQLVSFNSELQSSGATVLQKTTQLLQHRGILQRIELATRVLTSCQSVLNMFERATTQMSAKKYYAALKTLQQLQDVHLRRISEFSLADLLAKRIPVLRDRIKTTVMSDFRSWLTTFREHAAVVGPLAMKDTSSQIGIFEQAKVDFTPVYRCLHIYESLGARDEFKDYYLENRKRQLDLLLQDFGVDTFISTYQRRFEEICGFFVIERAVLDTTRGFLSTSDIESMWEGCVAQMRDALKSHFMGFVGDFHSMLAAKDAVSELCNTLGAYGYHTQPLLDAISSTRSKFWKLLMEYADYQIARILESDNYTSMSLRTPAEFDMHVAPFSLHKQAEAPTFPYRCSFSASVPLCCKIAVEFIHSMLKYWAGLSDNTDEIRTYLESVLKQSINGRLLSTLEVGANVNQAAQILVNAGVFEEAHPFLEGLLSAGRGRVGRLTTDHFFRETKGRAELIIYEGVEDKVREFFTISDNLDWTPSQTASESREYMKELVRYLDVTLAYLPDLPKTIVDSLFYMICRLISNLMMEKWASKTYTICAVYNYGKDLQQMEDFARTSKNAPMDLAASFSELRDLINIMLSEDFDRYVDDYAGRHADFPHLEPSRALVIMNKYKEMNVFTIVKNCPKLKRKSVDNMIKKLKEEISR